MGRRLAWDERLDAPLERVGGALERALGELDGWRVAGVDREGGAVDACWAGGRLRDDDQLRARLEPAGPGATRLRLDLETALPLARLGPRRARIETLLARVRAILQDG